MEPAVESYRKSLDFDSGYQPANDDLGHYMIDQGEYNLGIEHLNLLLDSSDRPTSWAQTISDNRNPAWAEARAHGYQKLGFAYHHLGSTDQASECFQKAWQIDHPSIILR